MGDFSIDEFAFSEGVFDDFLKDLDVDQQRLHTNTDLTFQSFEAAQTIVSKPTLSLPPPLAPTMISDDGEETYDASMLLNNTNSTLQPHINTHNLTTNNSNMAYNLRAIAPTSNSNNNNVFQPQPLVPMAYPGFSAYNYPPQPYYNPTNQYNNNSMATGHISPPLPANLDSFLVQQIYEDDERERLMLAALDVDASFLMSTPVTNSFRQNNKNNNSNNSNQYHGTSNHLHNNTNSSSNSYSYSNNNMMYNHTSSSNNNNNNSATNNANSSMVVEYPPYPLPSPSSDHHNNNNHNNSSSSGNNSNSHKRKSLPQSPHSLSSGSTNSHASTNNNNNNNNDTNSLTNHNNHSNSFHNFNNNGTNSHSHTNSENYLVAPDGSFVFNPFTHPQTNNNSMSNNNFSSSYYDGFAQAAPKIQRVSHPLLHLPHSLFDAFNGGDLKQVKKLIVQHMQRDCLLVTPSLSGKYVQGVEYIVEFFEAVADIHPDSVWIAKKVRYHGPSYVQLPSVPFHHRSSQHTSNSNNNKNNNTNNTNTNNSDMNSTNNSANSVSTDDHTMDDGEDNNHQQHSHDRLNNVHNNNNNNNNNSSSNNSNSNSSSLGNVGSSVSLPMVGGGAVGGPPQLQLPSDTTSVNINNRYTDVHNINANSINSSTSSNNNHVPPASSSLQQPNVSLLSSITCRVYFAGTRVAPNLTGIDMLLEKSYNEYLFHSPSKSIVEELEHFQHLSPPEIDALQALERSCPSLSVFGKGQMTLWMNEKEEIVWMDIHWKISSFRASDMPAAEGC